MIFFKSSEIIVYVVISEGTPKQTPPYTILAYTNTRTCLREIHKLIHEDKLHGATDVLFLIVIS